MKEILRELLNKKMWTSLWRDFKEYYSPEEIGKRIEKFTEELKRK
jgi:hypothetical protein